MRKRLQNRKGFTLVEMIVVVAIVGILAAIIVPSFIGYVKKARYDAANTKASQISAAAKIYLEEAEAAGFGMEEYDKLNYSTIRVPSYKEFVFENGKYVSGKGKLDVDTTKLTNDFQYFSAFPKDYANWENAKKRMELDFAFYVEDNVSLESVKYCVITVYFLNNVPVQVYYTEADSMPSNLPSCPTVINPNDGSANRNTTDIWDELGFIDGVLVGTYPIVE